MGYQTVSPEVQESPLQVMSCTVFPVPWHVCYHLKELSGQVGAVPLACRASVVHLGIYFAVFKLEIYFFWR